MAAYDDDKLAGCYRIQDCNGTTVELHTAMLPEFRGAGSQLAIRALFYWLHSEFPKIVRVRTWISDHNKAAMKGALRAGFTVCGTEPKSFLRYGELHDLHLLGVTL